MSIEAAHKTYTLEKIQALVDKLPRVRLAHLPTPLEPCSRLSKALGGPEIWIKRDDLTGLAFGGNKTRQIEFVLGEAIAQGANAIVTGAGTQSNFCRQMSAAAAKLGLKAHLILMRGVKGSELQGNLLLDHLLGAEVEIVDETDSLMLAARFHRKAADLKRQGLQPYVVDGRVASAPLLSIGYVNAMLELVRQLEDQKLFIDVLYLSAANMTHAGLALAAKALRVNFRIVGVSPIHWEEPRPEDIARIANKAAEILGLEVRLSPVEILNTEACIGQGYGIPTQRGNEALRLLAQTEGILLDPVYTAKAMAAVIDDIQSGRLKRSQKILFVHTGGTPVLFAYAKELAKCSVS